jgi:putative N6-adenine-specific DNA methylase
MQTNYTMVAKTLFGLENVLATELTKLGALEVTPGVRSVSFVGDVGFMYKANLACRTAIKILMPIKSFTATNETELYKHVFAIDWPSYFDLNETFAIDTTTHSTIFTHSKYASLKVKDAIADKFREVFGERPNVDTVHPNYKINVHIYETEISIALDSSGDSLHLRGYKQNTYTAPINEVLAAGVLLHSGWEGQCNFLDPMCGSGTILIEAAMIACNIPANINRENFAFENWKSWDAELFEKIRESLLSKTKDFNYTITGYDIEKNALDKTKYNVRGANLEEFITVTQCNFFETKKENEAPLHMVFNPPYNERIGIDTECFYEDIGNTFKKNYPGTAAWFITGNLEALKFVGLKPSRKIKLFNGAIEAKLVKYDIYAGSKRTKFQTSDEPIDIEK